MADSQRIIQVIERSISETNEGLPADQRIASSPDAVLFGERGSLDSLSLVNLIVSVEEGVAEEFGVSIVLADEKAMSRRTSPFRTVGTLSDYVATLLEGKVDG
jgi:acyl carrier protein